MHRALLSTFALGCALASGSVIRQHIISEVESCDITPAWERTNNLNIVPLVPEARTGLLPVEVEEGLIYALGPRFANVFIEDEKKAKARGSGAHQEDLSCVWDCAGRVIRLAPCIATALATRNPLAILSCGVDKGSVCGCVKCLPDPIEDLLKPFCSSSTLPSSAINDEQLSYPDWIQFSQRAPYLQGFRGDLKKTVLDEAKNVVANTTHGVGGIGTEDIFGFCPGTSCGGCGCCIGLCALGSCVGACT